MHIFIEESNQSWFIVFWWLFVVKNAAKLSLFFDSHLLSVLLPVYSVNGVIDDADKLDILSNVHVYLWFKFYYKPWGKFPRKMWMKILITDNLHSTLYTNVIQKNASIIALTIVIYVHKKICDRIVSTGQVWALFEKKKWHL